jgi:hypothetical protein
MEIQAGPVRATNSQNETMQDLEVNGDVMLDNMDAETPNMNDDFAGILPGDRNATQDDFHPQIQTDIEHDRELAVAQAFGMDQMAAALDGIMLEAREGDMGDRGGNDEDGEDDAVEIEWDQAEERQDHPAEDADDVLLQEAVAQRRQELEQLIADNGALLHGHYISPILPLCRTRWPFTRGTPIHANGCIQSEVWALSRGPGGARSVARANASIGISNGEETRGIIRAERGDLPLLHQLVHSLHRPI